MIELMDHQSQAAEQLASGKILWGGVGSGKSATVLSYYMAREQPKHIYVITTAKKRDSLDWEREAAKFGIGTEDYGTLAGCINVDSWNKISWYEGIEDAFFIFDEQRVVGHGSWVKSFLKIAKRNRWILLSATPGDTWMDYAPVFVANGYYKNITDFKRQHVLYEPFSKFPKIKGYLNERKLELLRNEVLVEMPYMNDIERHINYLPVGYNPDKMRRIYKDRWNIFRNKPIKDAAELFRIMRRVVNTDHSRFNMVCKLMKAHPRMIIFYNFDYELEILRLLDNYRPVYEWNGHRKQKPPDDGKWVYLVQYVSGAEGWNCTSTDAMVLWSLTYSYKNFIQARGRIDRLNTIYRSLYYYVFVSNSVVDKAVLSSLDQKKNFNEKKFVRELMNSEGEMSDSKLDIEENFEICQI